MPQNYEVNEITKIFNSVGFATVWSWLKPYNVLSTGEKMRVDLARAILEKRDLIVFDEFTSVINREVAKTGSFALQKSIRKMNKKFIALSCHYDIIDWLEPDWIFCTDDMKFKYVRGNLRRPKIKIQIREEKGKWEIFRKYHYLNSNINNASRQFVGYINDIPVVFFAVLHFPHPNNKKIKRGHRLVVLPDYQGLGIGHKFSSYIAEYFIKQGYDFTIVSSTKSLFEQRKKDSRWMILRKSRISYTNKTADIGFARNASKRKYTYTYKYVGDRKANVSK